MTPELLTLAGGVGLFLVGMQVMTEALRALASHHLRRFLARFTTSPVTGALTGAASTAVIQSSSATMVTVIGFVGAGLMTFPQALGVIFGANVGTTVTGWIVALLGLKLHLGIIALPLLLVSVLVGLLAGGRLARVARAVTGFSLIFIGLDMMKDAVSGFETWLRPEILPGDTFGDRALLLLIGVGITMVIQSSSAGIAATLVLLSAGSITLGQGAALAIGMDVGTTFTAILATIGGSRDMRRTAVAHSAYNVVTGVAAFGLLPIVVPLLDHALGATNPSALVAFHTLFNLIGVVVMLPLTTPFAHMIQRLVPGRTGNLTDALDRRLLNDPSAAMDAARSSALAIQRALFRALGTYLHPRGGRGPGPQAKGLEPALDELQHYLTQIHVSEEDKAVSNRYAALLHMFDHMHRMAHQMMADDMLPVLLTDPGLRRPALAFGAALRRYAQKTPPDPAKMTRLAALIAGRAKQLRRSALLREHVGLVSVPEVFDLTDAMRWLQRTAHNADRSLSYAALAAQSPTERPLSVRLAGAGQGAA
ncbi:Na/Pi cotransporter family protein [Nioella nitratireducens]|uniref:Na/Pi cotransporter family protein n=1 Tax=Nioella nitratireducens TaxID=1287720 RepID=UPI0008FCF42E|nr:Na/Pi symporter [Nioella nitratireducens]